MTKFGVILYPRWWVLSIIAPIKFSPGRKLNENLVKKHAQLNFFDSAVRHKYDVIPIHLLKHRSGSTNHEITNQN